MHKFGRMTGIIIKTNVQQVQVGYSTVKQTHCVSKKHANFGKLYTV